MKSKIAVMTVLVLGLQSAAFAAPRKGPIRPYPNPTLPQPTVVVSVIGETLTAQRLGAIVDQVRREGRRRTWEAPPDECVTRVGRRSYTLRPFSVSLRPLSQAGLRHQDRAIPTEVCLGVQCLVRGREEIDMGLTVGLTQDKQGKRQLGYGLTARITAHDRTGRFGEVSLVEVNRNLRGELPLGQSYAQVFVRALRVALDKSLPRALKAARR